MDFSQIKNHLISHREHAQHQIDYIKAHRHMEEDELHTYIYDYVLYKYNLFGEVADVYVLDDLAELSRNRQGKGGTEERGHSCSRPQHHGKGQGGSLPGCAAYPCAQ